MLHYKSLIHVLSNPKTIFSTSFSSFLDPSLGLRKVVKEMQWNHLPTQFSYEIEHVDIEMYVVLDIKKHLQ